MALRKYASFDSAQVLDLKGSKERSHTAKLDKLADYDDFRTDDGFLYVRIRAISSRVNKNHDGWPSEELAGGPDLFRKFVESNQRTSNFTVAASPEHEFGYSTFLGKPIFVDHHNSNPKRARGVIVDAKFHVDDHKTAAADDAYYASAPDNHLPPSWVELLLEVDANSFPKFAKAIIDGAKNSSKGIDGFSMGCDVQRSICNICKNSATTPDEYCKHIQMKGATFDYKDPDTGQKTSKKSYEDCYGIGFFEISGVFDPADETALTRELISSVNKEGSGACQSCGTPLVPGRGGVGMDCPNCGAQYNEYGQPLAPKGTWRGTEPPAPPHDPMSGPALSLLQPYQGKTAGPPPFQEDWSRVMNDVKNGVYGPWDQLRDRAVQVMSEGDPEGRFGIGSSDVNHTIFGMVQSGELRPIKNQGQPGTLGYPSGGGVDPNALYAKTASQKTAENPLPQADMTKAPTDLDTLRKETVCPVCGSDMDEETCEVCGFVQPPDGFDNPDLEKAQESDLKQEGADPGAPEGQDPEAASGMQGEGPPEPGSSGTSNQTAFAYVSGDMSVNTHRATSSNANAVVSFTNPDEETPVVPNSAPASDQPAEKVLEDHDKPVTSGVRTARDFIAAAGATETRRTMSNHKTADAASGAPADAKADTNVDTEGVGGVMDASNEEASKADAQVDVEAEGGTGVEGVAADSTVSVDQGDEHSKNIESIPTKTFDDGSSAVERQADPVGGGVYPSEGGVTSSWQVTALDPEAYPKDDGGLAGGGANPGTQPADPVGKPDERVNVLDPTTSPENNSGDTSTWSGTDGNGVTRQQEPVTNDTLEGEDLVNLSPRGSSTHILTAMKLADLEVELGLIDAGRKYERVAELENDHPQVLHASLQYAKRVKTAGLSKGTIRTAKKLPSFSRTATAKESSSDGEVNPAIADAAAFMWK